ncbi:glycosyltransferase family 39 protein [candidate division KSB1 bacterium]|nr:glycosyltransferase family 39 protein [candidate division KSB1 bacterium]
MQKVARKSASQKLQFQEWFYLILLLMGAVLFRLLLLSRHFTVGFDEVNYLKLAASGKLNGLAQVLHPYWSPLYPLAVSLTSYVIPNFEFAGLFVQIASSCLIILPLFFFVRHHFTPQIAWGTALLVAFFTFAARYSVRAETEFLYSFMALAGILLGWHSLKQLKIIPALGTGICFGLAYLTRPEGIGFVLIFSGISLAVMFYQWRSRPLFLARLGTLCLTLIAFLAVAFPYIYYLHEVTGVWTISIKGAVNQQGEMYVANMSQYHEDPFRCLTPDDKILLEDEVYHTGNFMRIAINRPQPVVNISPFTFIKKLAENYYDLLTRDLAQALTLVGVLLLGLGLFATSWSRSKILLNLYLLSFIGGFWFGLIPAFHITLRYFIPLMPLAFIWMAAGGVHLIRWFQTTLTELFKSWPRWLPVSWVSALLVIFFVLGGSILPELGKRLSASPNAIDVWAPALEQKKAGLWLQAHGVKSPIIMAYNHAVSFYAGNYQIRESVEIPENKLDRILNYARYRKVNYLVLDDRYRQYYPLLEHLYTEQDIPADLKLIYFDKARNGLRTWIYEIQY